MRAPAGTDEQQAVPPVAPRTRLVAVGFLLVVVVTSLLGVEVWPLNGWGFYSRMLSDRVEEWKVLSVDEDGTEHRLPWDRLPVAYRATYRQLPDVVAGPAADREAACRAWAEGVRGLGEEVAEIRIYWTETRRHLDGRPSSQRRRLEARCARSPG